MCGICGFIHFEKLNNPDILKEMVESLHHRGPDGFGLYEETSNNVEIGIGHTRLAILDLSLAGKQPMHYENFTVSLNGEIYNYREIRSELLSLGHCFVTDTDTEVLLHSISQWGMQCVEKLIGMFAFVVFDMREEKFYAIRDRVGVKPFYYFESDNYFIFASELKALLKHPKFVKKICKESVVDYFNLGYIPAPSSIYENCKKLLPGHILIIDLKLKSKKYVCYWALNKYYLEHNLVNDYDLTKDALHSLMKSSFKYRMISDVPVGVFLSGGYDSSAVTAILQQETNKQLKTFTVGFDEGVNEAPFASKIAEHLNTDHSQYICTQEDAKNIVSELPYFFDEPFADSSAIPTILVSKFAKEKVTVALSADGGDEIFAGYTKYDTYYANLSIYRSIPVKYHGFVSELIGVTTKMMGSSLSEKLRVFRKMLNSSINEAPLTLLRGYDSQSNTITSKILNFHVLNTVSKQIYNYINIKDDLSVALLYDFKQYLPDDVLTKVDRSSMSVALEGREPFLDHRILEFSAQMPSSFKYYDGVKKRILKDIVHEYIPKELLDRPKMGFGVPINAWLKKDLIYLINEYLSDEYLIHVGIFNVTEVKDLKKDFIKGRLENENIIWRILQFQMWYYKWMKN